MNSAQKTSKSRNSAVIMGVKIDSTPQSDLLNTVLRFLKVKKQFFIVTPNPEIVLMAQTDQKLLSALNSADISLPDGIGILFAAKILGIALTGRIPGRLFMNKLFDISYEHKLKVYLLGGNTAVINKTMSVLKSKHKTLSVEGSKGPTLNADGLPVSKEEENEELSVIKKINSYKPDILFIGFGAPKQEKWFVRNKSILQIGGAMVIGGSLDVYSGYKKTPPQFLSSLGLEWLWRLLTEPSRIVRILNATFVFPLAVFREKLR